MKTRLYYSFLRLFLLAYLPRISAQSITSVQPGNEADKYAFYKPGISGRNQAVMPDGIIVAARSAKSPRVAKKTWEEQLAEFIGYPAVLKQGQPYDTDLLHTVRLRFQLD
ncbi:hypothetical protein [Nibrella viscosa]